MSRADCTERMSAAEYRASLSAPVSGGDSKRMRLARSQPEFEDQCCFFILLDHLALAHPDRVDELRDIWASANGGLRSPRTSGRLRASGARKGVPDIEIMVPRNSYHAMLIEMKAIGSGRLSPEQKVRIARLNARGYLAVVAYGWVEAGRALCDYLGLAWQDRWLIAVPADKATRKGGAWCAGVLHEMGDCQPD